MRFSLKWILAAAVYVAVAAAAFSQPSWVYGDILWAMSLLALVFTAVMACVAHGRARVAAAGFLLAGIGFVMSMAVGPWFGGQSTPVTRVLVAAGFQQFPSSPYFYSTGVPPGNVLATAAVPQPTSSGFPSPSATLNLTYQPTPLALAPPPSPATPFVDFAQYVRAANAVGMMVFGMLGILVALLAARMASPVTPK